ncbi:glycoside hydrolase family 26 protein [Jidongwangia harbinensis]|uniref:glycoside hydrolase family 26 protein n=1 Tax=Jidongwangia harbinensis TaxID=2878561 RepID=UPI001CD94943|nr:hypothetical protein [Jidongwangia harbinensis]MCA2215925.1 hypothetical protein [Jidongwangia harbinensis]
MADAPNRGRRIAWFAAAAAALLLAGLGVVVALDPAEPDAPVAGTASTPGASRSASSPPSRSARALIARPRTAGDWPGANGLSGVNGYPILDTASVTSFCAARGRPCQIAQTYTDRTSYESMTRGSDWTFEFFDDFPGALVISQGLAPTGGEAELPRCAAGVYDEHWRDFGRLMVRHGRGDSVVRLGWEFNERTMPWRAVDTRAYVECYRRAADRIRETNPDVLLDWTINAHSSPDGLCGGRSTNCYPGDGYVDIIGIDNYDHYPWSPDKAAFDATAARPEGLTWLFEFARTRGKPFSVGEWGVVPTGDAGRENPPFVRWMHEWFAARAPHLAYEAYFVDCGADSVQSSLFRTEPECARNSGSSAAYRTFWGS